MIHKMFSVYDSKVAAYMTPFFMPARGAAIRAFIDTASDVNSQIGKHPTDFTLFELGEYDDSTAKVVMNTTPVSLGVAHELIEHA